MLFVRLLWGGGGTAATLIPTRCPGGEAEAQAEEDGSQRQRLQGQSKQPYLLLLPG